MMRKEPGSKKTVRIGLATKEGDFLVHYSMNPSFWKLADFDDALTFDDARKLANARMQVGYHTRISRRDRRPLTG